jgi:hypothetical protein
VGRSSITSAGLALEEIQQVCTAFFYECVYAVESTVVIRVRDIAIEVWRDEAQKQSGSVRLGSEPKEIVSVRSIHCDDPIPSRQLAAHDLPAPLIRNVDAVFQGDLD